MATTAVSARVQREDIKPKIGSRILNSKEELLSGELTEEINALLEQRGVLVFPGANFTDADQVKFTNLLGGNLKELSTNEGELFKVSLDRKINNDVAEYLLGSLYWHIDGTMNPLPVRASMLTAKVLSPEGGDTCFANTATAYEDLPEDQKRAIADLRVIHSLWISAFYHTPEPTVEQMDNWMARGEAELPLVCTHKSGRKSLILGNTAHYIKGMEPRASVHLLHSLRAFATSEPYMYTHKWTIGDTVLWDNRTSLHKATPYDPDSGRMMHRTILPGVEAWEN